jgi:hypothetical protein
MEGFLGFFDHFRGTKDLMISVRGFEIDSAVFIVYDLFTNKKEFLKENNICKILCGSGINRDGISKYEGELLYELLLKRLTKSYPKLKFKIDRKKWDYYF